ncbi:MAG: hypothetical protein ACE5OP_00420 [Candidatus Glassbacteria bacterium]
MQELPGEEKSRILMEEKVRLSKAIARMRSAEMDLILEEESPFLKRIPVLRVVFEVMIGTYTGIISILIVLLVMKIFS